jgi:hypothetical protein
MVAFSEPAEMMILIANILGENGIVRYFRSWSCAFPSLALSAGPARTELFHFPTSGPVKLFLLPRRGLGRVTFDDPAPD